MVPDRTDKIRVNYRLFVSPFFSVVFQTCSIHVLRCVADVEV